MLGCGRLRYGKFRIRLTVDPKFAQVALVLRVHLADASYLKNRPLISFKGNKGVHADTVSAFHGGAESLAVHILGGGNGQTPLTYASHG